MTVKFGFILALIIMVVWVFLLFGRLFYISLIGKEISHRFRVIFVDSLIVASIVAVGNLRQYMRSLILIFLQPFVQMKKLMSFLNG